MHTLTRGGRFKYARTVLNQHGNQSMDEVYSATWISPSMIKDLEDDEKNRSVGYDTGFHLTFYSAYRTSKHQTRPRKP